MRWIPIFCLLSFALFSACSTTKSSKSTTSTNTSRVNKKSEVVFERSETLSDVLDRAAVENKLVFVDFYATWCLPCKLMDEEVFTDRRVAQFLNDNFLSYKIDAEKGNGPNLGLIYNVKSYPTLIFMDTKGRVIEQKEGAAFQTELIEMGQRALNSQP